jgi:hypothetical protein
MPATRRRPRRALARCLCAHGRGGARRRPSAARAGAFVYDYADKIDKGICPPADAEELRRTATKQPFVCTSVQAAPGQPADALQRPTLGCLPQAGEYYPTLHPRDANYDPVVGPYGTAYNVSLNYEVRLPRGCLPDPEQIPGLQIPHHQTEASAQVSCVCA